MRQVRVGVYARMSTDKQREESIDDQLRECRAYVKRQAGWVLSEEFSDAAISGAATLNRPGFQRLRTAALEGQLDVVLAESLDRFSRDQEDTAALYKRLSFVGVRIVTLAEGEINHLTVGFKGTTNAVFLKDLADKTRRGLRGLAASGKHAGGSSFGFRVGPDGKLAVHQPEAQLVQRIFEAYAQGQSSRSIAHALNRDRIPGPRRGPWGPSTIHGNPVRQSGVLNNPLYRGEVIWNRLRYAKHPDTGKRVSRLNPESAWTVTAQPHLRIVSEELWQAVKARQAATRAATARKEHGRFTGYVARAQHLFSGLLRCAVCGGVFSTSSGRLRCYNHHERGKDVCSNGLTISRQEVEARVLDVLQDKLLTPELFATFCEEYTRELNALRSQARADVIAAERALDQIEHRRKKLIAMVLDDGISASEVKDEMNGFAAKREALHQQIALRRDLKPLLHPNMGALYKQWVLDTRRALSDKDASRDAAAALRKIVDKVVLTPENGKLGIIVHGELARLLAVTVPAGEAEDFEKRVSVVAGGGFEPPTFGL